MVFLQKYRLKSFIIQFFIFIFHTVCIIVNVCCGFVFINFHVTITKHYINQLTVACLRFHLNSSTRKSVTGIGHQRAV